MVHVKYNGRKFPLCVLAFSCLENFGAKMHASIKRDGEVHLRN